MLDQLIMTRHQFELAADCGELVSSAIVHVDIPKGVNAHNKHGR
jgi:hypothetical protein